MPRFSKRRTSINRRTRRTRRTGRSRRGGEITIPNSGLKTPMTIYYSSRPENPSKKVKLTTITTNNLKTPIICQIVDNDNITKYEDCNLLRKNAYSEEEFFQREKEKRDEYLNSANADYMFQKAHGASDRPISYDDVDINEINKQLAANHAYNLFEANSKFGVSERNYDDPAIAAGGSKRIKRRKTQKRRRR